MPVNLLGVSLGNKCDLGSYKNCGISVFYTESDDKKLQFDSGTAFLDYQKVIVCFHEGTADLGSKRTSYHDKDSAFYQFSDDSSRNMYHVLIDFGILLFCMCLKIA